MDFAVIIRKPALAALAACSFMLGVGPVVAQNR
jgi:hypothetical protein